MQWRTTQQAYLVCTYIPSHTDAALAGVVAPTRRNAPHERPPHRLALGFRAGHDMDVVLRAEDEALVHDTVQRVRSRRAKWRRDYNGLGKRQRRGVRRRQDVCDALSRSQLAVYTT